MQMKNRHLIKIGWFDRTTLYVIKKVISEADSNICGSYSLMPLALFISKVCLKIMLTVAPVSKALFLVDKTDVRRFSNDTTGLRCLAI